MCGNQFLESEKFKIEMKVSPECRPGRIIAIAENYLPFEMIPIMPELLCNI